MNIDAVMTHLEAAAKSLNAKPSVERGSGQLERFTRTPGIIIYPTEGNTRRDGSKVAKTPGTLERAQPGPSGPSSPYGLRYRLFTGQVDYAVRFLARSDTQLTEMLDGFLEYIFVHRLHDAQENYIALPSGEIRFSWRDPDGVLMGDHTVELTIPASAALYSDRERKLIDITVSYQLATSLEGEDLDG